MVGGGEVGFFFEVYCVASFPRTIFKKFLCNSPVNSTSMSIVLITKNVVTENNSFKNGLGKKSAMR